MPSRKTLHILCLTISAMMAMLWCASCRQQKPQATPDRPDTLCIGTATYLKADTSNGRYFMVRIRADYPDPITGKLSANIATWVRQKLGQGLPPDTMDIRSVVNYFGQKKYDTFTATSPKNLRRLYDADIHMVANRRNYVSYQLTLNEQLGEQPPVTTLSGITLRKSDGEMFGWNMISDTTSTKLRKLLREGVRTYIRHTLSEEFVSDENLREILSEDPTDSDSQSTAPHRFPLPKMQPILVSDGLAFVYQPYEIAPYSLGAPIFTIKFKDIGPMMTKDACRLLCKPKK